MHQASSNQQIQPIITPESSTKIVDRSPRSADTTNLMNTINPITSMTMASKCSELEKNREFLFSCAPPAPTSNLKHQQQQQQQQQLHHQQNHHHHHQRFSSTASQQSSCSSRLNSPIIMPAKSFPGFFPEPNNNTIVVSSPSPPVSALNANEQQQQQGSFRRSLNLNTNDRWPQQQEDENYHLYHEPIDMDELEAAKPIQREPLPVAPAKTNQVPTTPLRGSLSKIMNITANNNTNNNNNQQQNTSTQETSQQQQQQQQQPTVSNRRPSGISGIGLNKQASNDVSADIYFCYVSLKANERSTQRSRSYHGQKNNNNINTFIRHPHQTLASNSFAELPAAGTGNGGVTTITKSPSGTQPNSPNAINAHGLSLRDHCINELIGTEMNYTHALNHILTHFAKPLEPLLRRDENQLIFGHMKYFYNIHNAFQLDLVKNTPNVYISFLNFRDKFLRYGDYCASLSRAQSLLDELVNRNETFATQLARCHDAADEGKFKLADLLSLPMQRILKYHLLLAELIRCSSSTSASSMTTTSATGALDNKTPASTNDNYRKELERAHEAMIDLGKYINEAKRDTELMQIIDDIEQSISGLNMPANTKLTDYGRLHYDGILRVKLPQPIVSSSSTVTTISVSSNNSTPANNAPLTSANHHQQTPNMIQQHESSSFTLGSSHLRNSDSKLKQKRYAFVFDKVLVMCKVGGVKGYQYKEALVLSEFSLDKDPIIVQSDTISAKHLIREKWTYAFNLVKNSDPQIIYTFFAKDSEMKNTWLEAIQKAYDNLRPLAYLNLKSSLTSGGAGAGASLMDNNNNNSNLHDFLMHTFERASSCDYCGKLFHGIHYQGYRCRTCFASVHKACLAIIRPCGPSLPAKHGSGNTNNNNNNNNPHLASAPQQLILKDPGQMMKEPISPSIRSNSSDDSHHFFGNLSFPAGATPANHLHSSRPLTPSENNKQQPQEKQAAPIPLDLNASNSYVNSMLKHYLWFCGRMDREQAQALLESKPDGTFLVRVSPKHNGSYVISLIYNSKVNHMRIYVSKDNQLYLSQNRYFKSIFELVSWYEKNSLVESFHMLDAHLAIPYKKLQNLVI